MGRLWWAAAGLGLQSGGRDTGGATAAWGWPTRRTGWAPNTWFAHCSPHTVYTWSHRGLQVCCIPRCPENVLTAEGSAFSIPHHMSSCVLQIDRHQLCSCHDIQFTLGFLLWLVRRRASQHLTEVGSLEHTGLFKQELTTWDSPPGGYFFNSCLFHYCPSTPRWESRFCWEQRESAQWRRLGFLMAYLEVKPKTQTQIKKAYSYDQSPDMICLPAEAVPLATLPGPFPTLFIDELPSFSCHPQAITSSRHVRPWQFHLYFVTTEFHSPPNSKNTSYVCFFSKCRKPVSTGWPAAGRVPINQNRMNPWLVCTPDKEWGFFFFKSDLIG